MSFQHDKRIIVYPNYINSAKTEAEGRRIPKDKACENPNVAEMMDCCKFLKLPAEIEDKHYSRDWFIRGRLRVQLRNDDGSPVNPEIPNRRTLLINMAELVPKHPSRSKRSQGQGSSAAESSSAGAGSSKAAAAAAPISSKSSKKKGKK